MHASGKNEKCTKKGYIINKIYNKYYLIICLGKELDYDKDVTIKDVKINDNKSVDVKMEYRDFKEQRNEKVNSIMVSFNFNPTNILISDDENNTYEIIK